MDDDIQTPTGGGRLRERKRAATQAAIERAAVDLALSHGYEQVTVDMICEASMVSQRTFFNYFGSKEGVILGATPPLPTPEEVAQFTGTRGNVLADFLGMLSTATVDHEPDMSLFLDRRRVILSSPELLSKETARFTEFQDHFVSIVRNRYHAQGRHSADETDLEDEARMVVALATGVVHFLKQATIARPDTPPARRQLSHAIDLIHRITADGSTAQEGTPARP